MGATANARIHMSRTMLNQADAKWKARYERSTREKKKPECKYCTRIFHVQFYYQGPMQHEWLNGHRCGCNFSKTCNYLWVAFLIKSNQRYLFLLCDFFPPRPIKLFRERGEEKKNSMKMQPSMKHAGVSMQRKQCEWCVCDTANVWLHVGRSPFPLYMAE